METLRKNNLRIGDFAASLILENKNPVTKAKIKPIVESKGPDISKIVVEESFVNKITGKKRSPEELIKEFESLLIKGKELINEMTSCGMIGTTQAPTQPTAVKPKIKKKKKKVQEERNIHLSRIFKYLK